MKHWRWHELIHNNVVLCTDLQLVSFFMSIWYIFVYFTKIRNFSTYNYADHNVGEVDATALLWHEATAHQESTETAWALLLYINIKYSRIKPGQEIVWSEKCMSQSINWKMLTFLRRLVLEKFITKIEQNFLYSGYSFLPCDKDFCSHRK